jgi:hypothetical protein
MKCQGLRCAIDGEEAEANGVKYQYRGKKPVDQRVKIEGSESTEHGDKNISPIVYRNRRNCSYQDIPCDTAGIPRDEGKHKYSKQIEAMLHSRHCAADRENKRANEIERS